MAKGLLQPVKGAKLLSALATPENLNIVRSLTHGERNFSQIIEELKIPAISVLHHLTVLKSAGLIRNENRGLFVLYSRADGLLQHITNLVYSRKR